MRSDAWLFVTVNPHINAGNPTPGARPVRESSPDMVGGRLSAPVRPWPGGQWGTSDWGPEPLVLSSLGPLPAISCTSKREQGAFRVSGRVSGAHGGPQAAGSERRPRGAELGAALVPTKWPRSAQGLQSAFPWA